MNNSKWLAIAGSVLLAIILFVVVMQWGPSLSSAETLSEEEARSSILNRYAGEILQMKLEQAHYVVDLQLETGIYEIRVDAKSGDVVSLVRSESFTDSPSKPVEPITSPEPSESGEENKDENTVSEPIADPKPKPEPEPQPELVQRLTSKQAAEIAIKHIPGKVEDIESRQSEEISFYLIEIDLVGDREAIVQVNAMTGAVMSVSWDDNEWDDEDDDNHED